LNVEIVVINREEAAGPEEAWVYRRRYHDAERENGGRPCIQKLDKSKNYR
jgi:hypothetical protein